MAFTIYCAKTKVTIGSSRFVQMCRERLKNEHLNLKKSQFTQRFGKLFTGSSAHVHQLHSHQWSRRNACYDCCLPLSRSLSCKRPKNCTNSPRPPVNCEKTLAKTITPFIWFWNLRVCAKIWKIGGNIHVNNATAECAPAIMKTRSVGRYVCVVKTRGGDKQFICVWITRRRGVQLRICGTHPHTSRYK